MTPTVWVVVCGESSGPVGIFTSQESAKRVADLINKNQIEDAFIREMPVDPLVAELDQGYRFFLVDVDESSGIATLVAKDESPSPFNLIGDDWPVGGGTVHPAALRVSLWARDEAHAKERAVERWRAKGGRR